MQHQHIKRNWVTLCVLVIDLLTLAVSLALIGCRDLEEDHQEDRERLRLSIEADHQAYRTSAEGQIG